MDKALTRLNQESRHKGYNKNGHDKRKERFLTYASVIRLTIERSKSSCPISH